MSIVSFFLAVTDKATGQVVNIPKVEASNALLTNIFNVVMSLAGAVAVAYVVYGGIQYMLSQGEAAKVTQSRNTILYALIGIIVVVVSFMIVNFVIGRL